MRLFNQRLLEPRVKPKQRRFSCNSLPQVLRGYFLANKQIMFLLRPRKPRCANNRGSEIQKFCDIALCSLGSGFTEPDLHDLMRCVIADRPYCRNKKSAKLLSFVGFFNIMRRLLITVLKTQNADLRISLRKLRSRSGGLQKVSEAPLTKCPACATDNLKKESLPQASV